jgi:aminoglycoside phosphotransferase (APT) family kinase protein
MEYRPGVAVSAVWRVKGGIGERDAVLSCGRPAGRPVMPQGGGIDGSPTVVGSPARVDVTWYPDDPALPLLSATPADLARLLGVAAVPAVRLAWLPFQRATLRVGDAVIKLYHRPEAARAAVRALEAAADLLPAPGLRGARPEAGAVVQDLLAGTPVLRPTAAQARAAGRLTRRLHEADVAGDLPPVHGPIHLLDLSRPVLDLVAFALPETAMRVAALTARLTAHAPGGLPMRPAHGDLTAGQMLDRDGTLAVVDMDTFCLAPPALDLASFAANLVSGRADDAEAAQMALEAMLVGYGPAPEGLDWYLAAAITRRLDRALRRMKRRWPERTLRLLEVAEQYATRL